MANELKTTYHPQLTPAVWKWVTQYMHCEKRDLIAVDVHPDFKKEDKGWYMKSHFPKKTSFQRKLIHSCIKSDGIRIPDLDFERCNYRINVVEEIHANDKTLLAIYNNSPIILLIKKSDLW